MPKVFSAKKGLIGKICLCAICVSGISAQANQNLEEISVTSQENKENYFEEDLKTYVSAGSYSYLNDKNISTFRGSSVGDFLSGVPGVIAGNKRNSGALSINIRGIANENRVPVLVDKGLQSIPSWQGYAGSSTRTYLDPDLISKVEIEKGPSMEADATGAIGGMVRIKTLGWQDIIPQDKDWGVRLRLGSMDNNVSPPAYYTQGGYQTKYIQSCVTNNSGLCREQTYAPEARYSSHRPDFHAYNFSLALAKKWEHADVVVAYAKRKQGNYFVGKHGQVPKVESIETSDYDLEVDEITRDEEETQIGNVKLSEGSNMLYRAGEEALNSAQNNKSLLLKANFYNQHHRFGLAYRRYHSQFGELMSSILNFRAYGALQGEGTEIKVDSYSAEYQYNPDNPYINLNLSAYFTRSDSSNFTPFFEEFGYSKSSRHAHFTLSHQKGISLDNSMQFKLNNQPLSLKYGFSYSKEHLGMPKDAQQRVRAKHYPENAIAPLYVRNADRDEKSLFVALNYPITHWLKADLGMRYIHARIYDHQPMIEEELKNEKVPDNSPRGWHFETKKYIHHHYQQPIDVKGYSPIAMLTFEPTNGVQFYAKYAQAVRAPSLFQGSKGWSMQNTQNNLEQLKAERAKDWEIGANFLFENIGGKENVLGLKLSYFNNFIKNYLTRTSAPGGVTQTVNIESAQFKGVEASAYYDMRKFYSKFALTYYHRSRFCLRPEQAKLAQAEHCSGEIFRSNLNNQVPPRLNFHLTLGTRWLDNKFDVGARYSYYSKRLVSSNTDSRFVNTASIEWKPYSLVDLYANYQVTENFAVNFSMDNAFNRYYLDANNMGANTAPGRTMHIGIDYRF